MEMAADGSSKIMLIDLCSCSIRCYKKKQRIKSKMREQVTRANSKTLWLRSLALFLLPVSLIRPVNSFLFLCYNYSSRLRRVIHFPC
jgi:hypothetical protein